MSIWTHVTGSVRFVDFAVQDGAVSEFDRDYYYIFGKECTCHSSKDVRKDARQNPDDYMPMGSEGSLRRSMYNAGNCVIVSVFGDLRDYSRPEEIINWFKKSLKILNDECIIRQAVITVVCDGIDEAITYTYGGEENDL